MTTLEAFKQFVHETIPHIPMEQVEEICKRAEGLDEAAFDRGYQLGLVHGIERGIDRAQRKIKSLDRP